MATAPVKSPLHNFPLTFLKWGGGKNHASGSHRCRRASSADSSPVADHCEAGEQERNESSEAELSRSHRVGSRTVRNRFAAPFASCSLVAEKKESDDVGTGEGKDGDDREVEAAEEEMMVQKPWNLRPRKALLSKAAPIGAKGGELQEAEVAVAGGGHQSENLNQQPLKSMRLRGLSESQQSSEKKEKRKFWIALSRDEIEEDIFVMTGARPARRPRKRPKNVQKQLDACFPGLWLVGITADAYRIADAPVKRLPYIIGGQSIIFCKSLLDTRLTHCLLPCSEKAVYFVRLGFSQDEPMMRLKEDMWDKGWKSAELLLVYIMEMVPKIADKYRFHVKAI